MVLSHAIVSAHALHTAREMRLHSGDVWLHVAPMFHLVDAFAVYSVTRVCGRHVILPAFTAAAALRTIEQERVTASNMASTMALLCAQNPAAAVLDLSSLRIVSCGGSPLPAADVRRAVAAFGAETFISYGMTECCGATRPARTVPSLLTRPVPTGKISMSLLSPEVRLLPLSDQFAQVCTSGRPFVVMEVLLLDADGRAVAVPCPSPGVRAASAVGEIWIRGPTVFGGYWSGTLGAPGGAPARDCFLADGFFCTGDLGTCDSRGYLTVVDRAKDMVLCGGENVYCVEVEGVIAEHPGVAQAAVFGAPHDVMGETVVGARRRCLRARPCSRALSPRSRRAPAAWLLRVQSGAGQVVPRAPVRLQGATGIYVHRPHAGHRLGQSAEAGAAS